MSQYMNGPVKQEGICLMPQPHHFRIMPPRRTDGYQISSQQGSYVPQPPPGGNQGLRGVPQSGPPNQASTPPNDLSKLPQASMGPGQVYVNQQPVRYYRSAAPNQTRMQNQHSRPQQPTLYQAPPYMQLQPTMYLNSAAAAAQMIYGAQRPQGYVQPHLYPYAPNVAYSFQQPASQAPPVQTYNYTYQIRTTGPPPQTTSTPQNQSQASLPNIPMVPQPYQRQQNRRRPNALPIIDPTTGEDRLNEVFDQDNSSHPPSGESSARQTPQPAPLNKDVQATFVKQVNQSISGDHHSLDESDHQEASVNHMDQNSYSQSQAVQNPNRDILQSSTLMVNAVNAKEFVISSTAKETPTVSANCNSAEITLPNKNKDRESPIKGRKQREQVSREHKDSIKESNKDTSDCKLSSIKDDPKQRDLSSTAAASTTNVPVGQLTKDNVPHTREDKRNHNKKEHKSEYRVPSETSESAANVVIANVQTSAAQPDFTAKSKNVSQRITQKQPAPQTNNQKTAPANVPQPQPAKANNKTHKKTEINQKGANKEGTDMDAIFDNALTATEDSVNANVVSINTNDIINANSIPPTANNANQESPMPVIDNKKPESPEVVVTIKAEAPPKVLPKSKVDVTDIVRDVPKPMKPFPPAVDGNDGADRPALPNDKLVQVKNDANSNKAGTSAESATAIVKAEKKVQLPYAIDQWAPNNTEGKKIYDKDFLLALKDFPASRKKPDNLPDSLIADEQRAARYNDGRASMGGRTDFTNPPFLSYGGKSSSQRGAPPKRNSQSGKCGGNSKGGSKQAPMKISLSVREDVKLNEAENAWRPARFTKGNETTEYERKTADLYRRVRGVLNKLTPQKFNALLSQVKALQIDTVDRLQGVIDLVFEKAVDEPNFSVAYALMCKELAMMQVLSSASCSEDKKEYINFRKLLVTRCQLEFEKQSVDESLRNDLLKNIEEKEDPEEKKVLQFELEENDRKLRMKSVGNIRFIGELFKQNMLTVNIMVRCLNNLLMVKDEENLECLCKLLTTVGKDLESKNVDISPLFATLRDIVDKKFGKISSRVRFMIQDVIDLRQSKWIPRRQDLNPKTIDQIQKEAETEQMNIQAMNSVPITPRKDDRGGMSGNQSQDRKRNTKNVVEDGGWVTNQRRGGGSSFSVQSDKLKAGKLPPPIDAPMGSSSLYCNWGKGSHIKSQPGPVLGPSNNMYTALENMDQEKRPMMNSRPNNKEAYSSKGHSLERYNQPSYDGRGSRSGSQHRSNDNSSSMQGSQQQMTPAPGAAALPVVSQKPAVVTAAVIPKLTEEQLRRRTHNIIDEYLNDSITIEDFDQDIRSWMPENTMSRFIADSYLHVLDRSMSAQIKTGHLFAMLIKMKMLALDDYCAGLEEVLNQVEDLAIDIPKIWDCLPHILIDVVSDENLPLKMLQVCCKALIEADSAHKLLSRLFKAVVDKKGAHVLQNIWLTSGAQLVDFMAPETAENFLTEHKLEFLNGGECPPAACPISYEQIQQKLQEFLKSKTSVDDINKWISLNVGERIKEEKFIRALATAVFEDSIVRNKLAKDALARHSTLLLKYVDNDARFELQCLYALQALINKLEHPQGLLLSICDKLYEDTTFSQESFITWETSKDPAEQEGKGVALKQLTSFFTQLKENEEDYEEEEGSSSSEET